MTAQLDRWNQTYKRLLEYFELDLVRLDLGTAFNFQSCSNTLQNIINLLKEVSVCDLSTVPDDRISGMVSAANQVLDVFQKILGFKPDETPNPNQVKHAIIEQINTVYSAIWPGLVQVSSYSNARPKKLDAFSLEAESKLQRIKSLESEFEEYVRNTKSEMKAALDALREAVVEEGVSKEAKSFRDQAKEHKRGARLWVFFLIISVLLTIGTGAVFIFRAEWFYKSPLEQLTTAQIIQVSLSKVIILSIMYFLVVWTSKNFNSHRHNYIINIHRSNALSTFRSFVEAGKDDPAIKNAILLQTTTCIFTNQHSGYLQKDSDVENPSKMIEIVRNISSVPGK